MFRWTHSSSRVRTSFRATFKSSCLKARTSFCLLLTFKKETLFDVTPTQELQANRDYELRVSFTDLKAMMNWCKLEHRFVQVSAWAPSKTRDFKFTSNRFHAHGRKELIMWASNFTRPVGGCLLRFCGERDVERKRRQNQAYAYFSHSLEIIVPKSNLACSLSTWPNLCA